MTWFPYDKYIVTSKLTTTKIKAKFEAVAYQFSDNSYKLSNVIFISPTNTDSFTASFFADQVKVKEQIDFNVGGHYNSFRPEAKIKLTDTKFGSTIKVSIKPNIKSILFLCFAILFAISAVIFSKVDMIELGKYHNVVIVCLAILIMGYFVPTIAFNSDLKKLKLFIDDLLEIEYED